MANKLVYSIIAVAGLGLAFSVGACSVDAHVGSTPPPKAPEPAPPPPPAPVVPAPVPVVKPVPKMVMVKNVNMEGNRVKIPGELEFDVDKATLKTTPQSLEILSTLTEFMKQNAQVTKLRVEGHTDNTGKPEHNQVLAQERADAVVKYLSEKGVEKSRLVGIGYGAAKPLVDNDTPDHKAMNRRTEFHVAEIDGKPQEAPATPATGAAGTATPPAPAPTAPGHPGTPIIPTPAAKK